MTQVEQGTSSPDNVSTLLAEKAKTDPRVNSQQRAAAIIQKHFSMHPDSVIVVSSTPEGAVSCDFGYSGGIGQLLFMRELLDRAIDKQVNALVEKGQRAHADPSQEPPSQ